MLTHKTPINIACALSASTREELQIMDIPRQLKTAINKLAHAEGIRYESRIKAMLIEQLEAMREAGATDAELLAYLAARRPSESPDRA